MGDFLVVSGGDREDTGLSREIARRAAAHGGLVESLGPQAWVASFRPRPPRRSTLADWIMIGDVIERRSPSLDPGLAAHEVLGRAWGRFVGLRPTPDGRLLEVLRDPSAAFECLVWTAQNLTFITSCIPDWLVELLRPPWSIDWARLEDALHDPLLIWDESLLKGVVSVPPGASLSLAPGSSPRRLWSPARAAKAARLGGLSEDEARTRLTMAVDEAVSGLATQSSRVGAEVSGGLDSGIVASSLVGSEASVAVWLNAYAPGADSDERHYAARLAERLGIHLTIHERSPRPFGEEDLWALSPGVRPGLNAMDAHHGAEWARRWRKAEVDAVFTGKGGDSLFIEAAGRDVFIDIWHKRSAMAVFDPALFGLARWIETSVWTLIGDAMAYSPSRPTLRSQAYLAVSAWASTRRHPWLQDAGGLGPAKRYQIAGVANAAMFSAPSPQTQVVDLLHPLLSQPVVEVCLSLSAKQLTLGRRDRALARETFRHRLPAEIVDRRSKGDMTRFYGRSLAASLPALRPWLLEGRLAQRGLIDVPALSAALTIERLILDGAYGDLMRLAAFESWVRQWERRLGVDGNDWRVQGQTQPV